MIQEVWLLPILQYLDETILDPSFNSDIPIIDNERVNSICSVLSEAIKNGEQLYLYGDYDFDGFASVMVWKETLSALRAKSPIIFQYSNRTHHIDTDIFPQLRSSDARVVIICDTGSSIEDRTVLNTLALYGYTTIILDHHVYHGEYLLDSKKSLMFNSHEERNLLHNCDISGAYTSLIVAKVLCEKFMNKTLPYNAKVYALASMYADMVDMSSSLGRCLYQSVALSDAPGPELLSCMNQWRYMKGRRLYTFIINPKFNSCFRSENFHALNAALNNDDKYKTDAIVEDIISSYTETRSKTADMVNLFQRKRVGNFLLCVHEVSVLTSSLNVRNYTGLIANKIAQEEKSAVVAVVKDRSGYSGSFRDFFERPMLDYLKLFCEAGGHPSAFGVHFNDLSEFERCLSFLSIGHLINQTTTVSTLSSTLLSSEEDIHTIALYNEHMNVKPLVVISHVCNKVVLLRKTQWNNYYDLGLPGKLPVITTRTLMRGDTVLLEPCLCRGTELREKE